MWYTLLLPAEKQFLNGFWLARMCIPRPSGRNFSPMLFIAIQAGHFSLFWVNPVRFPKLQTLHWNFSGIENYHLDPSIASNSLFESVRSFESSMKQMILISWSLLFCSFWAYAHWLIKLQSHLLKKFLTNLTCFIFVLLFNEKSALSLVASLSTSLMSFQWSNLLYHFAPSLVRPLCSHQAA